MKKLFILMLIICNMSFGAFHAVHSFRPAYRPHTIIKTRQHTTKPTPKPVKPVKPTPKPVRPVVYHNPHPVYHNY